MSSPAHKCPVCADSRSIHVMRPSRRRRSGESLELRRCTACKTVSLCDWDAGYDEVLYDYYERYVGRSEEELFDKRTRNRYVSLLKAWKSRQGRLLDVGCGLGHFVATARELGWDASGIDLSPTSTEIGKDFGLPLRQLDLFDPSLDGERYDVITMFELLEHVPEPQKFLRRAEQLLRPGGWLYLTTPNFGALDRRLLAEDWSVLHPEHILYFDARSLRRLVGDWTSMQVVYHKTENLSVSAVRHKLNSFGRSSESTPKTAQEGQRDASSDDKARSLIHDNWWVGKAVEAVNVVLTASKLGNAQKMLLQRS